MDAATEVADEVDVLVVGAGPTGLMLGTELALGGVRVQILERRTAAQRDSRALTLHPRSIELMDQRGLVERFLARGRAVPEWHFAGLATRLDFSALDTRHGYTLFLTQARTEQLLTERASELEVPVRRGYEVVGLRQAADGDGGRDGEQGGRASADGVEVDVRGPDGGLRTVRARYVVGCDGGRSAVRRAAGIAFPGTDETLTGALGDFAVVDPAALDHARAAGVLVAPLEADGPTDGPANGPSEGRTGGLTRLVLIDPRRMRTPSTEPLTPEEFRSSLVDICGTDCGVARPRWLSRFGNATLLAARYRAGRVLLAGDAAHIHFPAAGQGLNTGLQDAMNLGWKLAAEINGWAPPGLLDSYHAERHPVGQAVTENTEVQTLLMELTLLPPYQRPAAALRTLLTELLGIEEVNRRLAGRISALDTVYPPTAADADPLTGRRMPDIALTADGSAAIRVHELLPHGRFVLLDLAGDEQLRQTVTPGWGPRVTALTVTHHDHRTDLDGVREILIRPDGHIAWATRTPSLPDRRIERHRALTDWAGTPARLRRPHEPAPSARLSPRPPGVPAVHGVPGSPH
ncbi:FAD-dependent monooxygenase [Streptomyces platensis]|uniref:FAD-dependent monooxygenase n=1 Tax=Streptomyces platensis TaxID=58346 RepID=UPI0022522B98|nr:FAD-dependent monooxygenase [Streptomyces platensis]MCX4639808.1 FAD-dependent monooxygenase [Streptomyces platensis]